MHRCAQLSSLRTLSLCGCMRCGDGAAAALELELGTELAAAELNISRWEPLQALAVERLDVCRFARQTLRRVHELALEPHAPHGQVRPLTPLRGGDRPHT